MKNHNQFVRQTAAVLLACSLMGGLLPGFSAAQDLSTVDKRAAWMIEQFRGAPMGGPNAKFGATVALARLALNPNDAEVISYITNFYDNVPAGKNGQQFFCPGVAWCGNPVGNDMLLKEMKTFWEQEVKSGRFPPKCQPIFWP